MLGKEDRDKINDLLANVFTDNELSLEELWPEMDNEETREYFEKKCSRIRGAINRAINAMDDEIRVIPVYIEVYSTDVDDAIEKVRTFLLESPHEVVESWRIGINEAIDYEEKGDH